MSDDLRDLYQEVILEHARKPRNFRVIDTPGVLRAEGFNRLCGDRLFVYLLVEDGVVKDLSFQGTGCAISTASASMMTQALKGKTAGEASALFERFHHLVTIGEEGEGGAAAPPDEGADLGKLGVFAGVREFPVRVKCATLAWHTLHAALGAETDVVVSTEE
jgi:nitrogen fixation protein NifU and related proteins